MTETKHTPAKLEYSWLRRCTALGAGFTRRQCVNHILARYGWPEYKYGLGCLD